MTDAVREIDLHISASFYPLLDVQDRYLVMTGGRGSGKSEFAARKLFIRCLNEGGHRFLVLRKVRKTAHESTLRVMRTLLAEQGIDYQHDKTHQILSFPSSEGLPNEILFDGLDEPEKIKSIKGLTGVWIEEATEFTERDFLEVDLALREQTVHYKQIMLTFNPDESLAPWLKKRFFPDDPKDKDKRAYAHGSTIEDNPIDAMRLEYLAALDAIPDETAKLIYRFGIWAAPKGQIYKWRTDKALPPNCDEIIYGLDFGYSVNPSALVRIHRKADELYVEELIYENKLTNQDLGMKMRNLDIRPLDYVYADSAEPKSIDEINALGFNVLPAPKGADSVRAGIDFLRSQKIFIVEGSSNIIKEVSTYKWKEDKNGDPLPEPTKFNDHALDAIRYAIYTHMKQAGVFLGLISHDVRPD
ncbi:MAG: PBSX family phage terminase large subunit [Chloroflexi bacterium]|nr:PBSX family phage terminase large subunit [Chloroflexota bacterium]